MKWKFFLPLLLVFGLVIGHAMKRSHTPTDYEQFRSDATAMVCYQILIQQNEPAPPPAPTPTPEPDGKKKVTSPLQAERAPSFSALVTNASFEQPIAKQAVPPLPVEPPRSPGGAVAPSKHIAARIEPKKVSQQLPQKQALGPPGKYTQCDGKGNCTTYYPQRFFGNRWN